MRSWADDTVVMRSTLKGHSAAGERRKLHPTKFSQLNASRQQLDLGLTRLLGGDRRGAQEMQVCDSGLSFVHFH